MSKEIKIKLSSYDHTLLDSTVKKFIDVAKKASFEIKGPIPLPTRREIWTFCRSPHVDKPAMESFERLTHKRLIVLDNGTDASLMNIKNFVVPAGVRLDIKN
ncbi:MAG: 30S ribosomal protein S10 [Mycoplasmataceae bacterium]|nr:30S ribosomal protein S10 [Mycoplasmataceae bacterium]